MCIRDRANGGGVITCSVSLNSTLNAILVAVEQWNAQRCAFVIETFLKRSFGYWNAADLIHNIVMDRIRQVDQFSTEPPEGIQTIKKPENI